MSNALPLSGADQQVRNDLQKIAKANAAKSRPAESAPVPDSLTRADLDALRASLDKLGRAMLASTLVGPHRTPEALRDQVTKYWEAL
jgi:hypothetical protein